MSVLVVGLSHRTAPVSLLERVALPGDTPGLLAAETAVAEHVAEAVVVSTCNRVEVYADVSKFHGGVADVTEALARRSGVPVDALTPHLYVHYEDRAVEHLFTVTCGLDSMVVGESQIIGQVRLALRTAQQTGAAGRVLNELVQHALRVGKRAHTETSIDRAGQSVVSVGLDLAADALGHPGGLEGRRALVVGAGSLAALSATTLRRRDVDDLVVLNRTPESAARLAAATAGRAGGLGELEAELTAADVLVSCTGAVGAVVDARQVARARAGLPDPDAAPLVVLDLALPRDVEPAVADLPGVTVIDLERLALALEGTPDAPDLDAVTAIVVEEVAAFLGWQRATSVAPTVVALRAMAAEVVSSELSRLGSRLPALEDRARDEVAQTVRRVVDKLLHAPTVRVKQLAGEPGALSYAEALRELFGLDPETVELLSRPAVASPAAADDGDPIGDAIGVRTRLPAVAAMPRSYARDSGGAS